MLAPGPVSPALSPRGALACLGFLIVVNEASLPGSVVWVCCGRTLSDGGMSWLRRPRHLEPLGCSVPGAQALTSVRVRDGPPPGQALFPLGVRSRAVLRRSVASRAFPPPPRKPRVTLLLRCFDALGFSSAPVFMLEWDTRNQVLMEPRAQRSLPPT